MLTVYAMCGLAFSGKSTLARALAAELAIERISLDEINHERGLHGGQGMTVAQWEETSAIAMDRLRTTLKAAQSAVVDDTFSHTFLRARCRAVATDCGADFKVLFVDTPIEVIRARRAKNNATPIRHHINDDVFEHHCRTFEFPTPDEPLVRIASDFDLTSWLRAQGRCR